MTTITCNIDALNGLYLKAPFQFEDMIKRMRGAVQNGENVIITQEYNNAPTDTVMQTNSLDVFNNWIKAQFPDFEQ